MSTDEHVTLDRASEEHWEYVGGGAFAMAGASLRHNALVMNIARALGTKLRGGPCFPLLSIDEIHENLERVEPSSEA